MDKKRAKQVTVVVDKKNMELGNLLLGLIAEKGYKVIKITPTEFNQNAKLSSDNKVIFLAPSKEFDERKKITPKIYTQYGMEYGWLANNCIIGVDSAQVKYEDKENISELFAQGYDYLKQKKDQEKKKDKESEGKFARLRKKAGRSGILEKEKSGSLLKTLIDPIGTIKIALGIGMGGYDKFKEYKDKKELLKDIEIYNLVNFVETDLDTFMEIE